MSTWTLHGTMVDAADNPVRATISVTPPTLPYNAPDGSVIRAGVSTLSGTDGTFSLTATSIEGMTWLVQVDGDDPVTVPDPGPGAAYDIALLTPAYVPAWQGGTFVASGVGVSSATMTEDQLTLGLSNGASLPAVTVPLGPDGPPGPVSSVSIGVVVTGSPGANAAASITGPDGAKLLNLTLPQGPNSDSAVGGYIATGGSATKTALDAGYLKTTDASAFGKTVMAAANAPASRAALGAGTSSLVIGTTSTTAAAGDDARIVSGAAIAAALSGVTPSAVGKAVLGGTAAAGLTALGAQPAGSYATTTTVATGLAAKVDRGSLTVNVKDYGALGDGTTDDTAAFTAAFAALPGGKGEVYAPPGTYLAKVTLDTGQQLRGAGKLATVIKAPAAATGAVISTVGYASLAGTNPTTAVTAGPYMFGIADLSIDGNKANATLAGTQFYGSSYKVANVDIYNCGGIGFASEWTNNSSFLPVNSMEAFIDHLRIHDGNAEGMVFNGPHDSVMSSVICYLNGTDKTNLKLDVKSYGTHIHTGHSWGANQSYALEMLAAGHQVMNFQAEGAKIGQVRMTDGDQRFFGFCYATIENWATAKGIVIDGASGYYVNANIYECKGGSIWFKNDPAGGRMDLHTTQTSGTLLVGPDGTTAASTSNGQMSVYTRLDIQPVGQGVAGYNQPTIFGNVFTVGQTLMQGSLSVNDTFKAGYENGGGSMAVAISTGTPAAAPFGAPGGLKLMVVAGTTGGTSKLIAVGTSGTVTTILDNIAR